MSSKRRSLCYGEEVWGLRSCDIELKREKVAHGVNCCGPLGLVSKYCFQVEEAGSRQLKALLAEVLPEVLCSEGCLGEGIQTVQACIVKMVPQHHPS